MSKQEPHITLFEHEILRFDKRIKAEQDLYEALERFHGDGVPYFKLLNNAVQFNEHVGVIQVGNTLIEVLPKADKKSTDKAKWQGILIGMMRAVYGFDIKTTGHGHLRLKQNSILHLYFEMFLQAVEYLLHTGLVKQYRKKEGNVTALKGRLLFSKQLQYNLTHQERFYVQHTTYDAEHTHHQILYKTLRLLRQINVHPDLHSRIGGLLLNFPEMPDLRVSDATFEKLVLNRKTQRYEKAIDIARLLLLNYHPDVSKGRNHVLALMFDMDKLWEQFVYVSLNRHKSAGTVVRDQHSKDFWQPEKGRKSTLRPDIWIVKNGESIVLDTKWKNIGTGNPSPEDLRQMYAYCDYFDAQKAALVYPGERFAAQGGTFLEIEREKEKTSKKCGIILLSVNPDIKAWQLHISEKINLWAVETSSVQTKPLKTP